MGILRYYWTDTKTRPSGAGIQLLLLKLCLCIERRGRGRYSNYAPPWSLQISRNIPYTRERCSLSCSLSLLKTETSENVTTQVKKCLTGGSVECTCRSTDCVDPRALCWTCSLYKADFKSIWNVALFTSKFNYNNTLCFDTTMFYILCSFVQFLYHILCCFTIFYLQLYINCIIKNNVFLIYCEYIHSTLIQTYWLFSSTHSGVILPRMYCL